VRVVEAAIDHYANTLPGEPPPAPDLDGGTLEERAAFSLTLNAINFGSGWFPTLRKAPGLSGFRTIEAGLRARGPWTAEELCELEPAEVAATFGQDPAHELMTLFTRALRELGEQLTVEYFGRFLGLVNSADGSAERLAETLARWPTWRDVSTYDGRPVPFFKRAQIAAADLHLAGIAPAEDIDRLTLFADNLVPHVLRLDGVLEFDERLVGRIDAGLLLEHGSPEEVEIRACALHAVELLVEARGDTTAAIVDNVLWNRGALPRYKARPRHRSRTTAY
jgi:Potential Queuosine, Q, salvage protein family